MGVDAAVALETMRLLTLCSLASSRPLLTFDSIAAGLRIEVGDVEAWVVKALTRGLVDAKIDQSASTVFVTRALQREVGPALWGGLQTKLRSWRDNVATLLGALESASSAGGSGRSGGGGANSSSSNSSSAAAVAVSEK